MCLNLGQVMSKASECVDGGAPSSAAIAGMRASGFAMGESCSGFLSFSWFLLLSFFVSSFLVSFLSSLFSLAHFLSFFICISLFVLIIKGNEMHYFSNLFLIKNSTCFGQICCPSSGASTLYTQQYMLVMLTVF